MENDFFGSVHYTYTYNTIELKQRIKPGSKYYSGKYTEAKTEGFSFTKFFDVSKRRFRGLIWDGRCLPEKCYCVSAILLFSLYQMFDGICVGITSRNVHCLFTSLLAWIAQLNRIFDCQKGGVF